MKQAESEDEHSSNDDDNYDWWQKDGDERAYNHVCSKYDSNDQLKKPLCWNFHYCIIALVIIGQKHMGNCHEQGWLANETNSVSSGIHKIIILHACNF